MKDSFEASSSFFLFDLDFYLDLSEDFSFSMDYSFLDCPDSDFCFLDFLSFLDFLTGFCSLPSSLSSSLLLIS